jgi:NADPH-dependent FMN reductase
MECHEGGASRRLEQERLVTHSRHERGPDAICRNRLGICAGDQGTISGALKNGLDWLHLLGQRDPPYLHDKVIGLISAAGGTQGLQAINTMEFAVRALRGWAVPYVVPLASAARVFEASGEIKDESVEARLARLGGEVVRVAQRFAKDPSVHREMSAHGRQKPWRPPASE